MRRGAGDHLTRLTTCQPKVDHLPANHHCPTIKCFSSLNCQLFVVELFSVPLIWIFLLRRPILKLTQHALLGWYRTIIQVRVSPCCIARLLERAGLFNPLEFPLLSCSPGGIWTSIHQALLCWPSRLLRLARGIFAPKESSKVTDKVAEDRNILLTSRDIFLIILHLTSVQTLGTFWDLLWKRHEHRKSHWSHGK